MPNLAKLMGPQLVVGCVLVMVAPRYSTIFSSQIFNLKDNWGGMTGGNTMFFG
jgi:hypothetical protein